MGHCKDNVWTLGGKEPAEPFDGFGIHHCGAVGLPSEYRLGIKDLAGGLALGGPDRLSLVVRLARDAGFTACQVDDRDHAPASGA